MTTMSRIYDISELLGSTPGLGAAALRSVQIDVDQERVEIIFTGLGER